MSPRPTALRRDMAHKNCRRRVRLASEKQHRSRDSDSFASVSQGDSPTLSLSLTCVNKQTVSNETKRSELYTAASAIAEFRGEIRLRKTAPKRLYLIPVLSKALDVLELLQLDNLPRGLESTYVQTNISKTTVYRILKTLVHRGYLAQTQDGLYRIVSRPRKIRFGFGSESSEMPFSVDVTRSLKAAAASAGVDLLVLDNRYDAAAALELMLLSTRTTRTFCRIFNRVPRISP